jgi:hypothetical protein
MYMHGTLVEPFFQWVAHAYESELETLVGIFGLGKIRVIEEQNGRDYKKYP